MEDKIVDCTQHSRELASKAINDSIDRAKSFITYRMYNTAIGELDYLKRLISIQDKYDALLFKMQKQQIEILSKTEA